MIITEKFEGQNLVKTYSNSGMMIRQDDTDILYAEAIDIEGLHTYTETDIAIEEDITPEEALIILLGGDTNESD